MKYCRQGEPLGRPGSAPRHLRYGKMRPMRSSVSRTLRALVTPPTIEIVAIKQYYHYFITTKELKTSYLKLKYLHFAY